jgi:hypothetical protein
MREEIGILCRNLECVAAGPERSRLSGEALSLLNEPLGQRPLRLLRCGDVLDVLELLDVLDVQTVLMLCVPWTVTPPRASRGFVRFRLRRPLM